MSKVKKSKKLKTFIKEEKGQGVMEYIILTGLVGIFCLAAVKKFGKSITIGETEIINPTSEKVICHSISTFSMQP